MLPMVAAARGTTSSITSRKSPRLRLLVATLGLMRVGVVQHLRQYSHTRTMAAAAAVVMVER